MKRIISLVLLLALSFVMSGCFSDVMILPSNDKVGESKTFEKDGIKLVLTDKFTETKSEKGFDAYYTADFCGVVVLKEEFYLEAGLAERSLEEYVANVIENNGHTDIKPQNKDDLWYYVKDSGANRAYSFSYKGSDAFYIVQFILRKADVALFEDLIFLWANSVEVK